MDIKKLIGNQEGIQWFEYRLGWELQIAYIPKRKVREIQRQARPNEQDREFYQAVMKGWRGLTPRKLYQLCKVDGQVGPDELDKEIPFDLDTLLVLVDAIYDIDTFVLAKCTDHRLYQPPDWEGQLKNLKPGLAGSSAQGDSPVKSA